MRQPGCQDHLNLLPCMALAQAEHAVSAALGIAKEIPTEDYFAGTNTCPVPVCAPCSGVL